MKLKEIILFFIIFNCVMFFFSFLNIPTGMSTNDAVNKFATDFTIGAVVGLLSGFGVGVFVSYFVTPTISPDRLAVYASVTTIILATYNTGFNIFTAAFAQFPVAIAFLGIVKIILGAVILFGLYEFVIGWRS